MRVMVIVKASKESEAGELPSKEILTSMGKYNEELAKAGIMLAGEGLRTSAKGKRVKFEGKKRTVVDGPFAETKELIADGKFLCMIGGEHSVSAPIIKAHAEKYHNLSVLQIDAHADLRDRYDDTPHSHASIMARGVKDLRIPSVQVGIRSISAEEARSEERSGASAEPVLNASRMHCVGQGGVFGSILAS